jgi:hypothetical protein
MDSTKRIMNLINITSELVDILVEENDALKEFRLHEIGDLIKDKIIVSRAYEAHVHELVSNPAILTEVDIDLHEKLRGLGYKANQFMGENARLLKAAINGNKQVMKLVSDAVKKAKAGAGTYSPLGEPTTGKAQSAPKRIAVSVDRSL